MQYKEKYYEWLSADSVANYIKKELEDISGDDNKIKERFCYDLKFGTAGLRGVIGAGTDRMNIYTVRRATQGLASYICEKNACEKGVAIAYDSRNFSPEFALEAACVLAGNSVRVYLFESLRPTPELSFAVRQLGCEAGIVVTASHNPKEYNGYKVYGSDGGQVANDAADIITSYIDKTGYFEGIKYMDKENAVSAGLINYIGKDVDEAYIGCVLREMVNPDVIRKHSDLKIVYTPFHGTGNILVREVLNRAGFKSVYTVPEQEKPDGNFPTVKSPNPENPEGFALAIKLAKEKGASLIVGTDPDSDRVGVLVLGNNGEFIPLTGNQVGVLLLEYILSGKKEKGILHRDSKVIKTIVTTNLVEAICQNYGVELEVVLTGFKYIADKIKEYEANKSGSYILGFEESYGYLAGTYARDKDAVSAVLLICEMAAYYAEKSMTLFDALTAVFEKYGFYKETNINKYFAGLDGMDKMNAIMENLRLNMPKTIGGFKVTDIYDINTSCHYDIKNGTENKINLPTSNVLKFELENDAWIAFRPSGTEPKLKAYTGVRTETEKQANEILSVILDDANKFMTGE